MAETNELIANAAIEIRHKVARGKDPILSGDFDRFLSALAIRMATDIHAQFGDSDKYSIADLEYWHGEPPTKKGVRPAHRGIAITPAKLEAACSAYGIPQLVITDAGYSAVTTFDDAYVRRLFELLGWESNS